MRLRTSMRLLLEPQERSPMLLLVCICFSIGCACADAFSAGPWLWLLPVLALPLWLGLRLTAHSAKAVALLLAFCAGLGWTQLWLHPAVPQPGRYQVTGVVSGTPKERDERSVTFRLTQVTLNGQRAGDAYCTLYADGDEELPALYDGAAMRLSAKASLPSSKENEYDFDYRLWLLEQGVGYRLTAIQALEVLNTPENAPWTDVSARLRSLCATRLERVMGAEARFAMAMLLGDRGGLGEDEQTAFQTLGVAHVMAVSGLHVGLLAFLLAALLSASNVRLIWQLPVIAGFLTGYCVLTGFSPASVRAAVMTLLTLVARLTHRKPPPMHLLAEAMVVVLLLNPLQVYTTSFVLSFSAMAGILLVSPRCDALWERIRPRKQRTSPTPLLGRLVGTPRSILCASVGAQAGVWLPTAAYFHRLPLYALAFNLLILPLMGLLVPLYASTLALADVPLLGPALGALARWGSLLLCWLVQLGASLPYASIRVPEATAFVILAWTGGVWALSSLVRAPLRRRLLAVAAAAVVAAAGSALNAPPDLRYHQLSVGQGDAAVLVDGAYTLAIDVGETGDEVADRLLAEGRDLDALILTHLHLDHAQGVQTLLDEGIRIAQAYLPEGGEEQALSEESLAIARTLRDAGVPVSTLAAGDTLRYNRTVIDVLWPEPGRARSGMDANARCLALSIRMGEARILSLGDLCDGLDRYLAQPCDVLKAAHHGSGDATGDALLNAASPRMALITCSSTNPSLPDAGTLARLQAHGVPCYRTDETGEITLTLQNGLLRAACYKARESQ